MQRIMVKTSVTKKQIGFVIIITILLVENSTTGLDDETCINLDVGQTCHATDLTPYRNYGIKTAYYVALDRTKQNLDLDGCVPVAIYLMSRHATRNPSESYIEVVDYKLPIIQDKIVKAAKEGKVTMCQEDVKRLKNWNPTLDPDKNKQLGEEGEIEAERLGERLREKYPTLLGMPYSPKRFIIEYTHKKRTKTTAEKFARGLFTHEDDDTIDFDGKENDKTLLFYVKCRKYRKKCGDPSYDVSEVEKFKDSHLFREMISKVSKRIGYNATGEEVMNMYRACIYSYALHNSDAWCGIFSNEDLQVLEFAGDLKDYYYDSYGNTVNTKSSCPVMKHIVDFFKTYEHTHEKNVTLHFSHSEVLKRVYSMLGLFHDEHPLTANNFCAQRDRQWQTSLICPFNSNVYFVLYKCSKGYNVVVFVNESPVTIGGCDSIVCPLENFYSKYEPIADNCNLKKICGNC